MSSRTVKALERQAKLDETEMVNLFNPLMKDFTVKWLGEPIVLKGGEFTEMSKTHARHVRKHLVDIIMIERGYSPLDHVKRSQIRKEIEL